MKWASSQMKKIFTGQEGHFNLCYTRAFRKDITFNCFYTIPYPCQVKEFYPNHHMNLIFLVSGTHSFPQLAIKIYSSCCACCLISFVSSSISSIEWNLSCVVSWDVNIKHFLCWWFWGRFLIYYHKCLNLEDKLVPLAVLMMIICNQITWLWGIFKRRSRRLHVRKDLKKLRKLRIKSTSHYSLD